MGGSCVVPICGACHSVLMLRFGSGRVCVEVLLQGTQVSPPRMWPEIYCLCAASRVCLRQHMFTLGCHCCMLLLLLLLLLLSPSTIAYSRLVHPTNPVVFLHCPHGVIVVCRCSMEPPAPSVVAALPSTPNQSTSAQRSGAGSTGRASVYGLLRGSMCSAWAEELERTRCVA